MIAVGVSTGIWSDENVAVEELKTCFDWLKQDVKVEQSDVITLLQEVVTENEMTALEAGITPCIYTHRLKSIVDGWCVKGYVFDKPSTKEITKTMQELGYRSNGKGQWFKKL